MSQGYGYGNTGFSGLKFGLNSKCYLKLFAYTNKGGKGGSDGEALDIIFNVEGKDYSYRKFPVTRAYTTDGQLITDSESPYFIAAMREFNSNISHILEAFVPKAKVKSALEQPFASFKEYCDACASILPENYKELPIDLFGQYQWEPKGENTRTYIELPKRVMKYRVDDVDGVLTIKPKGSDKWIIAHKPGDWKKRITPGNSLEYVTEEGDKHPFQRNDWFMDSNFAKLQEEEEVNLDDDSDNNSSSDDQQW
jgi:hypothetical protein